MDKETLATQFRLHLHRGIGYLAADPRIKREDMVDVVVSNIDKLRGSAN